MKPNTIIALAALACLFGGHFHHAYGQNVTVINSPRDPVPIWTAQPASVRVFPTLQTDFEAYRASHIGKPVLALTLPTVSAQPDAHATLQLAPQILTIYHDSSVPKAMAAYLTVSASTTPGPVGAGELHAVSTFLDFDELSSFRSVLAMLAASGVPASPVPEAKAQLSVTSKTGTRLEFTDLGGTIRCNITNEFDSVTLVLNSDGMKKMADTFFLARENLDTASDNMR
ncbi:MAG TPA: hypothetical protein VG759_01285 [Candidatus Angelobacter sp.]|jgi:hypothetical protein|nr:hypothetical protein [Candidatus Angelobacter sp.]